MGGLAVRGLTGALSWLDSKGDKDPNGPLKVRFLQRRPWPCIKVILVIGVKRSGIIPKQRYLNGLVDLLDVEQLVL